VDESGLDIAYIAAMMHVHYIPDASLHTVAKMPYTSPSSFSSSSTSISLSGDILGDRLIYLPLVSPSSPSGLTERDGERETKRPSELADEAEEDRLRRRRSGEEPREEGGVREGVRESAREGRSSSSCGSEACGQNGPCSVQSEKDYETRRKE